MSDETNVETTEESNSTTPEGMTEIIATVKNDAGQKVEATFYFDFKEDALEAIEAFGDKIVHERFIRAAKIEAQSRMRELLSGGKTPEEVADHMSGSWFPGAYSANTEVNVIAKIMAMPVEERAAFIEKLKSISGVE